MIPRGTAARFTIMLSVVLLGLVGIQVFGLMAQRGADGAADRRIQLTGDVEKIRYYDELLTMSARLAAASGDTSYVQRYLRAVPELSAVLEDAFAVVPDATANRALRQTDKANDALVVLEERSFQLLAAGHRAAAYGEVTSSRYVALKSQYADGMQGALARLDVASRASATRSHQQQLLSLAGSTAAAGLLVLLWLRTALGLHRSRLQRAGMEDQLRTQAHTDPLTGLANRRLFRQLLASRLDQPGRGPVAVLFADLDNFKSVNDTQGHADGDRLLAEVAERVGELLQEFPESVAARLGGDEFAVLLPETEEHAAESLAGRFVTSLSRPYTAAPQVAVTVSVGLAVSGIADDDPGALLRSADLAMYAAKEGGRDRWARYAPEMHTALVARVELEGQLREGLLRGELVLHYQPTYDLPTGQARGVEALVRWNHPTRGLLPPALFVPLAEKSDLIIGVGRIVLEQACRQLAAWRASLGEQAPAEVAVNVSPAQLHQPGFAAQVQAVLEVSGLPPQCLVLEVTESTVMRDVDAIIEILTDLRALGIRIAIDDFGTGHSSLSRLHELPTDEIKIDQSFVQASHDDTTLLELMITLASRLGLDIVAEGIETPAQLDTLRRMGCKYGQGYLLDRPLDVGAATAVFAPDASQQDRAPLVARQPRESVPPRTLGRLPASVAAPGQA